MKRIALIAIVLSLSCMAYASGWDIYMDTTSTPFQTYIANHPGVSGAIAPTRIHTSAGSDTLANATITGSVHTPRITTTAGRDTLNNVKNNGGFHADTLVVRDSLMITPLRGFFF